MNSPNASREWRVAQGDRDATAQFARALRVPRIVAHLLTLRGVKTVRAGRAFLNPSLDHLSDPFLLTDMAAAVDRIGVARRRAEHVLVFGDYDVDGIAGAALLLNALRKAGIARCSRGMPERLTEGYGIRPDHVERARGLSVDLIVTVDNGINARDAAQAARACGIDLIITDHHELEGALPEACAVINPKREDESHPARDAAGAAVAFKLACALGAKADGAEAIGSAMEDLDMVALGTVADIVPLRGENRDLVALGLRQMAEHPRLGLQALARAAGIHLGRVTTENIAFHLGPRINAGGRLGDGLVGLELLLTDSPEAAARLAGKLNVANQERRSIEDGIFDEAEAEIDQTFRPEQRTIVLARRGWHPGVIGIVASRLLNKYYRPVILVAIDDDGLGRGSARSIPGYDVTAALVACQKHLERFGGHQAAAGITVREENVQPFKESFETHAARQLAPGDLTQVLDIDALVSLSEIDSRLVRTLERLEPFGHGNPAPVFCSCGVEPLPGSIRELRGGHLRFAVRQGSRTFTAIGFRMADFSARVAAAGPIDIAFTPQFNTWQGETTIQLVLKDIRVGEPSAA